MRPSLVAVLVLSLVGLSGAALSDGMPAVKKVHQVKVKKTKVKPHRHTIDCPPGHEDDSWAIAEQLNHEEWLRHRQDDLHRRGGHVDDISRYGERYSQDYAWGSAPAHKRREYRQETWRDGRGEGARGDRDHGWAWRDDDRLRGDRYSYRGDYVARAYDDGPDIDARAYRSHGEVGGRARVQTRVYESHGDDGYAWGDRHAYSGGARWNQDRDTYAGGRREVDRNYGYDDARYFDDEAVYAGGSRRVDERAGRYGGERRVVIEKRRHSGDRDGRYGREGYGASGYGYAGGGYVSSYSSSGYGYDEGYGHDGGWSRGGHRFHYDAGYAGRDELGYLNWPGKAG